MTYYFLRLLAQLIPGSGRRQRFIDWARARFDVRAIVDTRLAEHGAALERSIYNHAHLFQAPAVMTVDETLDALIEGKSIARFGDGELLSLEAKQNAFQRPDAALAERLREILASSEPGLLVGIYCHCYGLSADLNDYERSFYLHDAAWMHASQSRFLQPGRDYAATEVTQANQIYVDFDSAGYFTRFRRIWEGEKVVLVHGEGIFDTLTHDIFDNAGSVEHLLAPRQDAFEEYDDILARALQLPKDRLMIAILGPTATVLAYDLHCAGYRALDLGHIAKSYDWWLKGRSTAEKAENDAFFAAD